MGAISNWIKLQNEYPGETLFCIVDLHSLTTVNDRAKLEESVINMVATFLACGIDPSKSILYNQSRVPGHSELTWILTCLTPMGSLKVMTQFKEKTATKGVALTGLFSYPVLMAADIMLHKATHVPVGVDQTQHLELARTLADKYNRVYADGEPFFPIPDIMHTETKRVMSLKDGTKKMSKSDPSEYSRIHLSDSVDDINRKILKAKTDCIQGISYDIENRPEVSNLLEIFSSLSNRPIQEIVDEFHSKDILQFKTALAEVAIDKLGSISKQYEQYIRDPTYLLKILDDGSQKARESAEITMKEVRKQVGLV